MGLEKIKDPLMRENWRHFINGTHIELKNANIENIEFSEFKNDGSYAKAKTEITATKWVFAQDSSSSWVELELKPRTLNGIKSPQTIFYQFIKSSYRKINNPINKITWNEEDLISGHRKQDCQDIRIKIYLSRFEGSNLKNKQWIKTMIEFIKAFNPIIQSYR